MEKGIADPEEKAVARQSDSFYTGTDGWPSRSPLAVIDSGRKQPDIDHMADPESFTPVLNAARALLRSLPRDAWFFALASLFLLLGVLNLNDALLYTPDCTRYLLWAESLGRFQGFLDNAGVEPHRYVIHAPLYSILLAPAVAVFSNTILTAKIVTLIFGLLLILLFYHWVDQKLGRTAARIGTGFLAVHPLMILYSTQVLSEISFCLLLLFFFFYLDKHLGSADLGNRHLLIMGGLLAAVLFVREVGVALFVGVVFYLLLTKEYRRAAIVSLLPVALYLLWYVRNEVIVAAIDLPGFRNTKVLFEHAFTPSSASLVEEFAARIKNHIQYYADALAGMVVVPQYLRKTYPVVAGDEPIVALTSSVLSILKYPLWIGQVGLASWGVVRRWRGERTFPYFVFFVAAFLGLLHLYPIIDLRFVFPLLFFILYFSLAGAQGLVRRINERLQSSARVRVVGLIAVGLLILPNLVWTVTCVSNNLRYASYTDEEFEALDCGGAVHEAVQVGR